MKTSKGFTLVELVLTIVIISVMLSIASLYIKQTLDKAYLQQGTHELISILTTYRQKAITEEQEVVLTFTENTNTYNITYKGVTTTQSLPTRITVLSVQGLTSGNLCGTTGYELHIHTDGGTCNNATITLKNSNEQATVNYKPSGFVKLQ